MRDAAGALVAYGTVMASPTFRDFPVYLEGRVDPMPGRGIGRSLLAWQRTRGTASTRSGTRRYPAP